jgi:hypothetical protein
MRKVYGLSIPDIELEIKSGEVCGSGCGSTEYVFHTKTMRDREAKLLARFFRGIAKNLDRGNYNFDHGDDPEESGSLSPSGYVS